MFANSVLGVSIGYGQLPRVPPDRWDVNSQVAQRIIGI
jgi:hypothetical protein